MPFPSDGRNHKKAVESEKNLEDYKSQIELHFGKKVSKILSKGGTTTKVDNIIIFEDKTSTDISLKNKKNVRSGSFDYVNTSNFNWISNGFEDTKRF